MPRLSTIVVFAVVALTAGALRAADADELRASNAPWVDARTACATQFTATTVDGDPNAVVARAPNLAGPFTGTITAYGADRMWTATIERAALTDIRDVGREASVTVRADAPIEGLVYAPAWAACTFHAGSHARTGYEARDVQRPVLTVGSAQSVERAGCEHPYASPRVTRAFEPTAPYPVGGLVRVAVALDERGVARFTRIVSSPADVLNASAADAAKRSEYSAAVFRCKPVPSGYEFAVDYAQ